MFKGIAINNIIVIFLFNIVLFVIHEMDAVKRDEWRMFVFLKKLNDKTAYTIFLLSHIPLFFVIIYFITSSYLYIFSFIMSIFFIIHGAVHFIFRNNKENKFSNSIISNLIIYCMSLLSVIYLFLFCVFIF